MSYVHATLDWQIRDECLLVESMKSRLRSLIASLVESKKGTGSQRQTILSNVTWLAMGNVLVKPLWFVLLLLTARLLGAAEFGQFMLAISFVSVASVLLEGGVDVLTIRELSDKPSDFEPFIGHTIYFKMFAGILSGVAAVAASLILKMNWGIVILISLASLYSLANILLTHFRSVFRAFEVLKYEAISMILEKGSVILLCTPILLMGLGVRTYMVGYVVAYCITSLVTFFIVLAKFGIPHIRFDFSYMWKTILKPALPFAVLGLFTIIYFRSGTLMLAAITGRDELVGYYNAGYRLVESFMLFPTIIVAPIYPFISRNRDNIERVRDVLAEAFRGLLFISVSISFPIFIFRHEVTAILYGSGYKLAADSVGLLAFTMIPISINFAAGSLIAALDRQGKSNIFVLAVTLANILLNYFLIRIFSVFGSAMTTVMTETLLVVCNLFIVRDYIPWERAVRVFFKALLPAVSAGVIVYFVANSIDFPLQVIVAAIIMLGGYFSLKLITVNDIRRLLHISA